MLASESWCRVVWCRGCGCVRGSIIIVVVVACVASVHTLPNQACVTFISLRLVGSMVVWFVGWLAVWFVGLLVVWLVDCLAGWVSGWLVGGLLVGWLVGERGRDRQEERNIYVFLFQDTDTLHILHLLFVLHSLCNATDQYPARPSASVSARVAWIFWIFRVFLMTQSFSTRSCACIFGIASGSLMARRCRSKISFRIALTSSRSARISSLRS